MVTKKEILNKLNQVNDPELAVSIVDLGLIYEIKIKEKVYIKMTFTTPACPMMNYMLQQVKEKLDEIEGVDIEVDIVFDPPWTPERMSKKAKMKLGIL
ncbi:metal-sulfur cluster assembly factor [Candidatus Micrarchaeota archaeon]|nr:metal-sulfur cluster assembly factor [Candidatus Micrarchaeota archaeon]